MPCGVQSLKTSDLPVISEVALLVTAAFIKKKEYKKRFWPQDGDILPKSEYGRDGSHSVKFTL